MPIALSVLGASGKMGRRILQLALEDPQFLVVGGGVRKFDLPIDDLNVPLSLDAKILLEKSDVAIDFSSHLATQCHLEAAVGAKKGLVIGTTGHLKEELDAIEEAAKFIPILFSPNFSFGMALCLDAVSRLGKALYGTCTIDIIETHHTQKKDCPSGTALALANAASNQNSSSDELRKKEQIHIHSIRSGETIGEHVIAFECGHERIELKHIAHSRDAFAQGALVGAKFLARQPPGLYSLKDLFSSTH